jgi:hypothetical protein
MCLFTEVGREKRRERMEERKIGGGGEITDTVDTG